MGGESIKFRACNYFLKNGFKPIFKMEHEITHGLSDCYACYASVQTLYHTGMFNFGCKYGKFY